MYLVPARELQPRRGRLQAVPGRGCVPRRGRRDFVARLVAVQRGLRGTVPMPARKRLPPGRGDRSRGLRHRLYRPPLRRLFAGLPPHRPAVRRVQAEVRPDPAGGHGGDPRARHRGGVQDPAGDDQRRRDRQAEDFHLLRANGRDHEDVQHHVALQLPGLHTVLVQRPEPDRRRLVPHVRHVHDRQQLLHHLRHLAGTARASAGHHLHHLLARACPGASGRRRHGGGGGGEKAGARGGIPCRASGGCQVEHAAPVEKAVALAVPAQLPLAHDPHVPGSLRGDFADVQPGHGRHRGLPAGRLQRPSATAGRHPGTAVPALHCLGSTS